MSIKVLSGVNAPLVVSNFHASADEPITLCGFVKVSGWKGSSTVVTELIGIKESGGDGWFASIINNSALRGVRVNSSATTTVSTTVYMQGDADGFVDSWRPFVAVIASPASRTIYTRDQSGTTQSSSNTSFRNPVGAVDLEMMSGVWSDGDISLSKLTIFDSALSQTQAEEFFDTGDVAALSPFAQWDTTSDWGVGNISDESGNARDITPPAGWDYSADEPSFSSGLTIDSTDASMQRDTNWQMVVSNPTTAPTTGNTTLINDTTILTPSSVTGSDPYTLTFPVGDMDKQVDATGYPWTLDINGETVVTANIPLTIQAGYTLVDLVDPITTNGSLLFGAERDAPVTFDHTEYTLLEPLDDGVHLTVAPSGVWTVTEDFEGAWTTDIPVSRRVVQQDGSIGTEAVLTLEAATGLTTLTSIVRPLISSPISNPISQPISEALN